MSINVFMPNTEAFIPFELKYLGWSRWASGGGTANMTVNINSQGYTDIIIGFAGRDHSQRRNPVRVNNIVGSLMTSPEMPSSFWLVKNISGNITQIQCNNGTFGVAVYGVRGLINEQAKEWQGSTGQSFTRNFDLPDGGAILAATYGGDSKYISEFGNINRDIAAEFAGGYGRGFAIGSIVHEEPGTYNVATYNSSNGDSRYGMMMSIR